MIESAYRNINYSAMAKARIFKPAKNAMQSGTGNTNQWCLEYINGGDRFVDPIMGWTGSTDMQVAQVRLYFNTQEEAIAYAKRNEVEFELFEPQVAKVKIRSYVDNYRYNPDA